MVIIGVELRLREANGFQEEIGMLGCHIEIPASVNTSYSYSINGTIHTTVGDINFGNQEILRIPAGQTYMNPRRLS